jgi:hypothetical protein
MKGQIKKALDAATPGPWAILKEIGVNINE